MGGGKGQVAEGACRGAAQGQGALADHGHQGGDAPLRRNASGNVQPAGAVGQRLQGSCCCCPLLQVACMRTPSAWTSLVITC